MRLSRRSASVLILGAFAAIAIVTVVAIQLLAATPPGKGLATPSATVSRTPLPTAPPLSTATPTVAPSPTATLSPILAERFTILVLGTDSNAIRAARGEAPRTDAILVVSVGEDQSSVTLISIPRDTVDVPLPGGGLWTRKINAMYADEGASALRQGVETLLGLEIHRHLALNMDTFQGIVEKLDRIEVELEHDIVDPTVDLFIPGGLQHLDATEALRYARHRAQGGDYARSERHQRLTLSLAARAASFEDDELLHEMYTSFPELDTDISVAELPTMLELARRAEDAEVRSVVLKPPDFALFAGVQDERGWIIIPDVAAIQAEVARVTR